MGVANETGPNETGPNETGPNETGPMELKSKSSQNRVPKQSLREDMSTERQAKNKKKQKNTTNPFC